VTLALRTCGDAQLAAALAAGLQYYQLAVQAIMARQNAYGAYRRMLRMRSPAAGNNLASIWIMTPCYAYCAHASRVLRAAHYPVLEKLSMVAEQWGLIRRHRISRLRPKALMLMP